MAAPRVDTRRRAVDLCPLVWGTCWDLTPKDPLGFLNGMALVGAGQPSSHVAGVLGAIDVELGTMQTHALAKNASRRVLGVMNDFAQLAEHHRLQNDEVDLVDLSLWLAAVPCSPLYKSHVSPDRALQALLGRPADTVRP